jgi:hypothetical protein
LLRETDCGPASGNRLCSHRLGGNLGCQTKITLVNYHTDVPYEFRRPSGLRAYFWSVQYQNVPRSPTRDICGFFCSQGRARVTPAHARRIEERLCLWGPSNIRTALLRLRKICGPTRNKPTPQNKQITFFYIACP